MEGRMDRMLASRSSAELAENSLELSIKGLVKDTLGLKQARRNEQKRGKSAGVQRTIPVSLRREVDRRRISVGSAKARLAAPGPVPADPVLRVGMPDGDDGTLESEVFEDNDPLSRPTSAVIDEVAQRRTSDVSSTNASLAPAPRIEGDQTIDMFITNRGKATANNFLTERDKSALKVGRLILASIFEQPEEAPTTSDAISRFFFDAWLNKSGSSLKQADTLSIELMSTLQRAKAESEMQKEQRESAKHDPPETAQVGEQAKGQEFSAGLAFAALDYVVQEFGAANPVLREIRDILAPCIFMEPPSFEESMALCGRDSLRNSSAGGGGMMDSNAVLHTYEEQDDDDISLCSAAVQKTVVENPGRIRSLGQQYANKKTWYGDIIAVHEHAHNSDHAVEQMRGQVRRAEEALEVAKMDQKRERLVYENRIEDIIEGNKELVRRFESSEEVIAQKEKEMRAAQFALGNETKALVECQQREKTAQAKLNALTDKMELQMSNLSSDMDDLRARIAELEKVKAEDDEVITGLVANKREADEIFKQQAKQKREFDEKLKQRRAKDPPPVSRLGEKAKTYHEYIESTEGFLSDQYARNNQRLQAQGKELENLRAKIREMAKVYEDLEQEKIASEASIRQEMATNLAIKDNEIAFIEDKVRRAELEIVKFSDKYAAEKDKAECVRILLANKELAWKEDKERMDEQQEKMRVELVGLRKQAQDAVQLTETQKEKIGSLESLLEETSASLCACREKITELAAEVAKLAAELEQADQVRQLNEKEIGQLTTNLEKKTTEVERHMKGNQLFVDQVAELTGQNEQLLKQAVAAKEKLQNTEAALESQTERTNAFIASRNTVLNDLQHGEHVLYGSEATLEHMRKVFDPYANHFQSLEDHLAGIKAEQDAELARLAAEKAEADAQAAAEAKKLREEAKAARLAARLAEGGDSDSDGDDNSRRERRRKERSASNASDESSYRSGIPSPGKRRVATADAGAQTEGFEGLGVLMDQFHGIDFSHIVGSADDYDIYNLSSAESDTEAEEGLVTPAGAGDTSVAPPKQRVAPSQENVLTISNEDSTALKSVDVGTGGSPERESSRPPMQAQNSMSTMSVGTLDAVPGIDCGNSLDGGLSMELAGVPEALPAAAEKPSPGQPRVIAVTKKADPDMLLESEQDPHIDEQIEHLEQKIARAFRTGANKKEKRSIDKEFKNVLLLLAREKLRFMDIERKYNIYKAEVVFEKQINSKMKNQIGDMRVENVNLKRALKEATGGSLSGSVTSTRRGSVQSMTSGMYTVQPVDDDGDSLEQYSDEEAEDQNQDQDQGYEGTDSGAEEREDRQSSGMASSPTSPEGRNSAPRLPGGTDSGAVKKPLPRRVLPPTVGSRVSRTAKRTLEDNKLTYLGDDGKLHETKNRGDRLHKNGRKKHEFLKAHAHEQELQEKVKTKTHSVECGGNNPIPMFEDRGMVTENDTVKALNGMKKPPKDVAPFINFIRQHEKRYALEVGKLSIMLREGSGLVHRIIQVLESLVPAAFPSSLAPVLDIAKVQEIISGVIGDIEDNEWIFDNNLSAAEVTAVFGSEVDPVYVSSQMRQFTTYNLDLVKSHQFLGAPVEVDVANIKRRQSMIAMRQRAGTGASFKNQNVGSPKVTVKKVVEDPTEVDLSSTPSRNDSTAFLQNAAKTSPTAPNIAQIAETVARSMSGGSTGSFPSNAGDIPRILSREDSMAPHLGGVSQESFQLKPFPIGPPTPLAPVDGQKSNNTSPDRSRTSPINDNSPEMGQFEAPVKGPSLSLIQKEHSRSMSLSVSPGKPGVGREGSSRFGSPSSLGRDASRKFSAVPESPGQSQPPTTIMMREGAPDDETKRESIVSIIEALREHFRFHKAANGDWKSLLYRHDGTVDTTMSLIGYDADETVAILKEMVEGLKNEQAKHRASMNDAFKKLTTVLASQNNQIAEFKRTIQLYKSGQLKPDVDLAERMKKLNQEMSTYAADGVSLPYYLELESAVQKVIHVMTSLCSFNVGTVAEGVIGEPLTAPVTDLMSIEITKSTSTDALRSEVLLNRESLSEIEGMGIDSMLTSSLAESLGTDNTSKQRLQQMHGSIYNQPCLSTSAPKGRVFRKLVSRQLVEGYLGHKKLAAEEETMPGFLVTNSLGQRNRRGWKKSDIIPALTQDDYKVLQNRHATTTKNLMELCDKLASKILCIDPNTTAQIMKKFNTAPKQPLMRRRIAEEDLQVGMDDDESMTTPKPAPPALEEDSFINFDTGIDTSQITEDYDMAGGGSSFVAETALSYNSEINEHVHEILRLQDKLKKLNALDDTAADTVVNRAKNCYRMPSRSLRELFPTPANEKEIFGDSKHKSLGEFMGNGDQGMHMDEYKDPFDKPKVELRAPPMLSKVGQQEAIATAAQVASNTNFIEGVGGTATHSGRIDNQDGLQTFRKRLDKLPLKLAKAAVEKKLNSGPINTITTSTGASLPFPILDTFNHSDTKGFGHLTRTKKTTRSQLL